MFGCFHQVRWTRQRQKPQTQICKLCIWADSDGAKSTRQQLNCRVFRSDWHPIRLHISSSENKSKYMCCRVYARVQCFMVSFYMAKNCFICKFVIYMFAYTWHSHDWCRSGIEPFFLFSAENLAFPAEHSVLGYEYLHKSRFMRTIKEKSFLRRRDSANWQKIWRLGALYRFLLFTAACERLPALFTHADCTPLNGTDWQPQIKSNRKSA